MAEQTIQERMEAHAREAVDQARQNYQAELDFSDHSVRELENILGRIHSSERGGFLKRLFGSGEEKIRETSRLFGAYLGETLRMKLGGEWVQEGEESPPFLRVEKDEVYPISKVYKRLKKGAQENVWHFYRAIAKLPGAEGEEAEPDTFMTAEKLGDALRAAAGNCDIEQLKNLLQKGGDVNQRSQGGLTALHQAVGMGYMSRGREHQQGAVELLIESGADVNLRAVPSGMTPLHFAALSGQERIVGVLLDHGARVEEKNDVGKTPIDIAVEGNYHRIVELLESKREPPPPESP